MRHYAVASGSFLHCEFLDMAGMYHYNRRPDCLSNDLVTDTFLGHAALRTVPTTPFTKTEGTYDLSKLTDIIIDSDYANEVDNNGQTLVPPTLSLFGETFQEDLKTSLGLDLQLVSGTQRRINTIFVTLGNSTGFRDAAGRWTSEGYDLVVDDHGIIVTGASPLGAWWATRSIIQAAVTSDSVLDKGTGTDAPGWGTRGVFVLSFSLIESSAIGLIL